MPIIASITVRAGSEDPIDFTLRHDSNADGTIDAAINLTGVTRVTLFLKRDSDGLVSAHATDDALPKLTITNAAAGQLRFSPAESTWSNTDRYYTAYFLIIDSAGKDIPVPEDDEFVIHVRRKFT